jgi:AcrR family transcriptional regulator
MNTSTFDQPISASAERRAHAKAELRQAILKAAGELFLERGYEGFSMRQVAERIGYTATTLYLYFKNKEDLLFALLDEGYAELSQRLQDAAVAEPDPVQRLARMGSAYVAYGLQHPLHYQLMFMRRPDFLLSRMAMVQDATHVNALDVLQQAVGAALAVGALKPGDALTYSLSLWSVVHGVVALALMAPLFDAGQIERMADVTITAYLEGVRHA